MHEQKLKDAHLGLLATLVPLHFDSGIELVYAALRQASRVDATIEEIDAAVQRGRDRVNGEFDRPIAMTPGQYRETAFRSHATADEDRELLEEHGW